jgi:nicotinamidase-related amidase
LHENKLMESLPRNPELMSRHDTALLIVDVQEKLVPSIVDQQRMVWNIRRLFDAAQLFEIPIFATEQYPRGLGPTIAPLAQRLENRSEKLTFSCGGCGDLFHSLAQRGIYKLAVAGIETHVCVQQTVFDLLADGFQAYVQVDAVGSRHRLDHEIALRRFESAGAWITTTEATLFEWCETAADPQFKALSALVREADPSATLCDDG